MCVLVCVVRVCPYAYKFDQPLFCSLLPFFFFLCCYFSPFICFCCATIHFLQNTWLMLPKNKSLKLLNREKHDYVINLLTFDNKNRKCIMGMRRLNMIRTWYSIYQAFRWSTLLKINFLFSQPKHMLCSVLKRMLVSEWAPKTNVWTDK